MVDPSTPVIRAHDPGVTRGDGCFEGCRLVGGVVAKLDAHLDRMARSAGALGIPFDRSAWVALVQQAVDAWGRPDEAGLRLVLTRGAPDWVAAGYALVTAMPAEYERLRRDGLRVVSLSRGYGSAAFRDAPWLLGGVKTLSYAINMAAQREADRRGADDAIFLSSDGYVLESPTGSVVWAVGRTLFTTPTGDTGILASTTQRLLFEQASAAGWGTEYRLGRPADLRAADVAWLIGSGRGPIDIVELDGARLVRRPDIDAEIRRLVGF